jgi:hypothetical protein
LQQPAGEDASNPILQCFKDFFHFHKLSKKICKQTQFFSALWVFFIFASFPKKGIADQSAKSLWKIFHWKILWMLACIGLTLACYYHRILLHDPELLEEVLSPQHQLVAASSRCKHNPILQSGALSHWNPS